MVQCLEDGAWEIGLYAPRSNTLIALDSCWVQDTLTQQLLEGLNQRLCHHFGAKGVKGVLGRSNGKGVLLTWLLTETPSPKTMAALKDAGQSIPGVVGCFYHLSPQDGNALIGKDTVHLSGVKSLEYQVRDVVFSAGPVSFVQTTIEGAELLVDEVRRRAPQSIQHLVDLYGGVGLFALALGGRAESVTVVERDGPSSRDGQANLQGLGTYVCGDVSQVKDQLAPMDVMVVDPPRAGLSPSVLQWIGTESKPRQLIYVSCSESTLVRDLQALLSMGYQARDVTPVDLFPHTPHLELVTHLSRVD
jgi:23S rRNA (uracil1939-C5)-methyltransferase